MVLVATNDFMGRDLAMINAYAASKPKAQLEPFEYDPGALKPHEVEIDVQYCGICHSDLSMIDNEWGFTQYPIVPGHEVVGTVAQVGENVKQFKPGELVGLGWHSGYCMNCHQCLAGDHNLCSSAQPTIAGHHGGFADKVRANAISVFKLPAQLDPAAAGPLFCGGITVFNPLVQFNVKPTDRAAVIGIGGLGHMALQFLNAFGCEVTAFTSSEEKIDEAKKLGAHHTINSRSENEIKKAAGKFDFIISTVNVPLDWNAYIAALKPKGRLHFVGAVTEPLNIQVMQLIMAQRSISASPVGSPATIATMLDFAARHKIQPVIEKFPLEKVNDAIQHLREGRPHYRIVLCRH